MAYLENSLHLLQLWEGVLAREHLDNKTAKTPNIRLACVRSLLDNLGGHPEHGALQRWTVIFRQSYTYQHISDETIRKVMLARTVFDLFRDAKVGKLDTTLVIDEDVCTLDVTVDDRLPMEVLQAAQDLSNPVDSERLFKSAVVSQQ
jgi:hypothetical protein